MSPSSIDPSGQSSLDGALTAFQWLTPRKLHPLLEETDPKAEGPKNYSFWTFAAHMTQIPPKKYNFTQFAAFFHFLFIEINYYFV